MIITAAGYIIAAILVVVLIRERIKKKKDNVKIIQGKIESISEDSDEEDDGDDLFVTFVGFTSGDGVVLKGVHPGLRIGKSVKLYLEEDEECQYMSTPMYQLKKVEKVVVEAAEILEIKRMDNDLVKK